MIATQTLTRFTQSSIRIATTPARLFSSNEGAGEWGIKYNDECLKFEKEWKQIADKIEGE